MRKISAIAIVALLMLATVQIGTAVDIGGTVDICAPPLIGIEKTGSDLNFGNIYPGATVTDGTEITITATPDVGCAAINVPVDISVDIGNWIPTELGLVTTLLTPIVNPYIVNQPVVLPLNFQLVAATTVVPGVYTQTITVTQIS